jgi:hypothetical protein
MLRDGVVLADYGAVPRGLIDRLMMRALGWNDEPDPGWSCSVCPWKFPVPTFLSDAEARSAYDRLAKARFHEHACDGAPLPSQPIVDTSREPLFIDRVRKLLKVGYKPKDAVELALQDVALEHRNDSKAMAKARTEADDFLRKIREGLI